MTSSAKTSWARLLLVTLLALPLVVSGLANRGFWLTDEPFVAEVAREMATSGDWVTPRLNGEPFLEKPPLHYAAVAACYRAWGVDPLTARIPSAVCSLLTVVATFLIGRRLFDERTAKWGALLLPTVYMLFYAGHYCLVDTSLTLFVTLGFLAGSYAFGEDRRRWAIPLVYVSAALAFLSKGPVGPGMLAIGLSTFAIVHRDAPFFRSRGHLFGLASFAAIVGPWLAVLWSAGGRAYYREVFVANTLGRFLHMANAVPAHDRLGSHAFPIYDYLLSLPLDFLPWTPLLVLAVIVAATDVIRIRTRGAAADPAGRTIDGVPWGGRFVACAILANLAVLSAAVEKRGVYALPIYPLLALFVARTAARLTRDPSRSGPVVLICLAAQGVLLATLLAVVAASPVYFSGARFDFPPDNPFMLRTAILGACGVVLALALVIVWLRRNTADIFRAMWVQSAFACVAFSLFVAPALGGTKDLSPFFSRAFEIEKREGRVPMLLTSDESYTGYAGLYFQRPLPLLRVHAPGSMSSDPWPKDVIADPGGLARLRSNASVTCEVLLSQRLGGGPSARALYLVRLTKAPIAVTPHSGG